MYSGFYVLITRVVCVFLGLSIGSGVLAAKSEEHPLAEIVRAAYNGVAALEVVKMHSQNVSVEYIRDLKKQSGIERNAKLCSRYFEYETVLSDKKPFIREHRFCSQYSIFSELCDACQNSTLICDGCKNATTRKNSFWLEGYSLCGRCCDHRCDKRRRERKEMHFSDAGNIDCPDGMFLSPRIERDQVIVGYACFFFFTKRISC